MHGLQAACVCDAENGWTGEIISPADLCRRETGLGPGLIVLMSVAVGLGAALGAAGFLYRLRVSPMVGAVIKVLTFSTGRTGIECIYRTMLHL